jgi:hypothetical protein
MDRSCRNYFTEKNRTELEDGGITGIIRWMEEKRGSPSSTSSRIKSYEARFVHTRTAGSIIPFN